MSAAKCLPLLAIGSLGGTVSMQVETAGEGITPSLSGEALLAGLPLLQGLARISAETLQLLPSASLTFIQLLDVAQMPGTALGVDWLWKGGRTRASSGRPTPGSVRCTTQARGSLSPSLLTFRGCCRYGVQSTPCSSR